VQYNASGWFGAPQLLQYFTRPEAGVTLPAVTAGTRTAVAFILKYAIAKSS